MKKGYDGAAAIIFPHEHSSSLSNHACTRVFDSTHICLGNGRESFTYNPETNLVTGSTTSAGSIFSSCIVVGKPRFDEVAGRMDICYRALGGWQ
ncbi:hypothetical protein KW805_02250 [Candidatus Pacearchaeota archaeon]|nr:hypothetical protein [Candidatus Pacearchaeota archaeon]